MSRVAGWLIQGDRLRRPPQRHRADQYVRQTRPRLEIQFRGERRTAQIGLDEQHHRARPGRRDRQVTGNGRLSLTGSSRCHEQKAQLAIDVEVAQTRADQLERLFLTRR